MALSPQTQAVGQLNEINALCVLLSQFMSRANMLAYLPSTATILPALPTCALNSDGSLGTPDAVPVPANPINAALIPGLNRACTPAQYAAAMTLIETLISESATPGNLAVLAPFLGG